MPDHVYEALLAGALAVQAVLFGMLGIFYTVHATFSLEAQKGEKAEDRPTASDVLRGLSKLSAWLAAFSMVTGLLCFNHLAQGVEGYVIVAPLGLTTAGMVLVGFLVAYKLMK
jgi:hypothetical protein